LAYSLLFLGAAMVEPDADHYRYRALLKAADDEPKRLALIQLLIDEGARDKLAAKTQALKPEEWFPLPRTLGPEANPKLTSQAAARPIDRHQLREAAFARTDEASMKFASLADRFLSEALPERLPTIKTEPTMDLEHSAKVEPPGAVEHVETRDVPQSDPSSDATQTRANAVAPSPASSKDSEANDLADRIAVLLSGRAALVK
jgi:hypothetical protein